MSLTDWLDALASSAPAPGGGAAAAMSTAIAAATLEMVVNLSIGRKDLAEHEEWLQGQGASLRDLRGSAVELAAADARAFTELMAAYRLPKGPERTATLQERTEAAARVPLQIAVVASSVCERAEPMSSRCNRNVVTDVSVAASTAAAAIESAAANVWINTASLRDPAVKSELESQLQECLASVAVGRRVAAEIRKSITR